MSFLYLELICFYMLYVENGGMFDLNISVMQYLMHHNMRSLVKMLLMKLSWGA